MLSESSFGIELRFAAYLLFFLLCLGLDLWLSRAQDFFFMLEDFVVISSVF